MTIVISVTQAHIDAGVPWNGECCPIAKALNDLGFRRVFVDCDCLDLVDPDEDPDSDREPTRFQISGLLRNWISRFDDDDEPVEPIRIELINRRGDRRVCISGEPTYG